MVKMHRLYIAFMFLVPSVLVAQQKQLPRVLIIGDSIYQQTAPAIGQELRQKAIVVHARMDQAVVCNSATVLANLDAMLGDHEWDVIHFNVGLGDLVYRAPGMDSFRILPIDAGGVRTTPPEAYEKNLRTLVARLQATEATLIWASTTPIRHSSSNVFEKGSEKHYNEIAAKVMAEHNITINDMYHHVLKLIDMQRPASHGADPFFFDRKPIHPPIVQSILQAL